MLPIVQRTAHSIFIICIEIKIRNLSVYLTLKTTFLKGVLQNVALFYVEFITFCVCVC